MRVLQLIDSLQAGGAERMAVNYANALVPHVDKSFLCATREEGRLQSSLIKDVCYLFLDRKKTFDFKALSKLNRFVKEQKINIVHAHGTSFFIASLLKLFQPSLVLIWHDHYGGDLAARSSFALQCCSRYFNGIIAVNKELQHWSRTKLKRDKIYYIKNFVVPHGATNDVQNFKGIKGKRIVCVANLRPAKNHGLLLDAFKKILQQEPEATLHLFGMQFDDIYACSILQIIKSDLPQVYYHGSHPDVMAILPCFDVGVLSSDSEGLPLALLEYGQAALPVAVTNVGQCKEVLSGKGLCVNRGDAEALANAICYYLENPEGAQRTGSDFQRHILAFYGMSSILPTVLKIYEETLR